MSQLTELLERVKAATGPDREWDADVAVALGHEIKWKMANYTMEQFPAIYWKAPHPYAGECEPCPKFTASIDAANGLIKATLPGMSYGLDSGPKTNIAFVDPHDHADRMFGARWVAEAATPALAILAALLTALIAKESA